MLACLVEIDAYDPVAAAAVTLCASSVDDGAVCGLNGQTWWPALAKLPTLRYDLFDGAFGAQITAPSSSLTMQTEPWPNFGRYELADARFRLWTGALGDAWGSYTLRFDGRVSAQPKIKDGQATVEFAVNDRWLDTALLATYAGTTGAEGPAALKGMVKPLALGAPRYVAGVLIDSVNNVFQISAYGSIQSVEYALERLVRFGASLGDYASYAALVAATIPAGRWATAKAVGMVRFGAPTTGQVSFLAQGDNAGTDGWARKPGELIRRLAILSGGSGKIDDTSLDALDVARPYNGSEYVDEQTTARVLIQKIAAGVNAVAGVSWTGQLFVAPVGLDTPTVTLAADGSALPPVASVEQIDMAAPWQKLAIGAERAWQVHALADIAFTATLIDMGPYASGTTYREGNIVQDQNSSWLYINPTPAAGNAPPTLPTTSNSYWKVLAKAGANGTDGTDGTDGTNGTDGADGDDGNYKDTKFLRSNAQPPTPTGDDPAGWSDGIPAGTESIWQVVGLKQADGTLIGVWSVPQAISGLTSRGAYNGGDTYYLNNTATYNGGSYIALQDNFTGHAPSGTGSANAYWDVLAAPGSEGAPATPPSAFSATIPLSSGAAVNLYDQAVANGYTGHSDATITFQVPNGVTIRGLPSGIGIDSGTWPSGYTLALTLVVQSGGVVDGGGGNGGFGGGGTGGSGGDAIFLRTPFSGGVTIDSGGTVRGGGGGGGGGATTGTGGKFGGGGGGGGAPNGAGSAGVSGWFSDGTDGNDGSTSGGGSAGSPGAGAGGGYATAGGNSSNGGGMGGSAGYAVRKNGNTATVTNNGTMTGSAA